VCAGLEWTSPPPAAHDRCVSETFKKDQRDIDAVLAGDGEAYARLVARHQGMIAGRLWRFTRDRRQLEDLVADVFVEAYTSLANFRGEGEFSHWLSVIATRVGYRFWKRRDRLVLTLLYWEGMSVAQAAGETGWSESMVKVQAHRARKKLRRWLE